MGDRFNGGGRVGNVYASWPLVTVVASADQLDVTPRLVAFFKPFVVSRSAVTRVRLRRVLFWEHFEFEPADALPFACELGFPRRARVSGRLRELGWPVAA